ncbi:hypothetical protein Sste5346_007142 [Sporothrix stenoceras]|uniref:Uncharacterized protein n=1 Tax=Sporothrix stenoceras TaxID=5173 RepID=A0ABR3YV36_9PEZI
MTGIIRFPRGGRPNKVTKPPAPTAQQTRRAANGSNGSATGASAASTGRQLAIEQALSEQQQQQEQEQNQQEQQDYATATSTETTDNLSPEQARSLIQDGPYYSTDGGDGDQAHTQTHTHTDSDATDYGAKDQTDGDHSQEDGSNIKADRQDGVDSNMLDLHGSGDGGATHNGHAENIVTDINEAEMSEMVGDAVNSYTGGGENGVGVARHIEVAEETQPTSSNGHRHEIDMDLSAAAAAAAAAAAVASASHLATTGQSHVINHLHNQTQDYNHPPTHAPAAQMVEAQHQPVGDNTELAAQSAQVDSTVAAPEAPKEDASTTPPSTADLARDSGYSHLTVESALAKRLSREPGLRPAQQRRPDQQLNLGRRSNVEALFAHIAGAEVTVPCKNCHKGHGPWTACVVIDGQMCGSCANCWFNASGARCSFHETKTNTMQGHLHGRQSLGGGVPASPSTAVPSALDPQLAAAAAGTYTINSPLGGGANSVHHHFSAQQQQHQHQNSLPSTPPSSSSAAQQAAAAAAAAAVAVQQLSNGGHFPGVPPPPPSGNGAASNSGTAAAVPSASPFSMDLVTALLGANRGDLAGSSTTADTTPLVNLVINQALAEVRNADQRGRDLMLVEIAAKQLALAIVRYGEGASAAAASAVPAAADVTAPDGTSTVKDGAVDNGNTTDGTAPGPT